MNGYSDYICYKSLYLILTVCLFDRHAAAAGTGLTRDGHAILLLLRNPGYDGHGSTVHIDGGCLSMFDRRPCKDTIALIIFVYPLLIITLELCKH